MVYLHVQSPRHLGITMGVQHRPVAGSIGMCISHHSRSDAVIEISKAGKHRRATENTKPGRRARTATVPVVRGDGTGKDWPPHIRKSSELKGKYYQPGSPNSTSTLLSKEAGGDKGKVVVPAPKAKENR